MVQDLKSFLAERKCKGFVPRPHYFPDGDFVTFYQTDEPCYEERVDDLVTVYKSMDSEGLVGCKIKGVLRILKESGNFGVIIEEKGLRLSFVFMIASILSDTTKRDDRKIYQDLAKATKDVYISRQELPSEYQPVFHQPA